MYMAIRFQVRWHFCCCIRENWNSFESVKNPPLYQCGNYFFVGVTFPYLYCVVSFIRVLSVEWNFQFIFEWNIFFWSQIHIVHNERWLLDNEFSNNCKTHESTLCAIFGGRFFIYLPNIFFVSPFNYSPCNVYICSKKKYSILNNSNRCSNRDGNVRGSHKNDRWALIIWCVYVFCFLFVSICDMRQVFTDGCTNKLIGCCIPKHNNNDEIALGDDDNLCHYEVILIRIYGKNTEVLIDRHKEIENFKLLHKYGFAPMLLATFDNGLSYEYSNGKPLSKSDVYDEEVWRMIARRMAEMHRDIVVNPTDQSNAPQKSTLWTKLRNFFDLIPTKYTDPVKQKRFVQLNRRLNRFSYSLPFDVFWIFTVGFFFFIWQARTAASVTRWTSKGIRSIVCGRQ